MVIFLTLQETVSRIHSLGMFSHKASLERISAVMERLSHPERKFPAIHLAGTNGKGSTAAMTASVLRAAGYKTGLFVSPYILDFRERIQIDGVWISEEALVRLEQQVHDTGIELTEFEMITAIGFLYFAACGVDVAVVETGLGGRFDATNVLSDVRVHVLTKIGLDHTAVLGDTLAEIAAEKCGIIKSGKTVSSLSQPEEALRVLRQHAADLILPNREDLEILKSDIFGSRFLYQGVEYSLPLAGLHQIENALTSIEAVKASGFEVSNEQIRAGIAAVSFPVRLETVCQKPLVVLDGAHNPDGAAVLKSAMQPFSGKIVGIFGMMRDKSCADFAKTVLPLCKTILAVRATESPRALSPEEVAQLAKPYCGDIVICNTREEAVRLARQKAGENPVFGFGSLYLAAALRQLF